MWITRTYKSIVTKIELTTALTVKSISGVTSTSRNTPGTIKYPYLNTIISPTLKKEKRFQTGKIDGVFFRNSDPHNSAKLDRKRVIIPREIVGLWLEFSLFGS